MVIDRVLRTAFNNKKSLEDFNITPTCLHLMTSMRRTFSTLFIDMTFYQIRRKLTVTGIIFK